MGQGSASVSEKGEGEGVEIPVTAAITCSAPKAASYSERKKC